MTQSAGLFQHQGGPEGNRLDLAGFQTPDWVRDTIWYHIFVDRFADGDPSNNDPNRGLKGRQWYGGDLQGVLDRLPHIASLGANAIWLSPFYQGADYHGYHITDFRKIDPRFGTEEVFRQLLKEARSAGIRVILDFVPNHSSDQHPFFQAALKDRNSPYYDYYTFTRWPEEYNTFFGVRDLPQFNDRCRGARDYVTESALYWLENFGVDGLRLDYVPGPSHDFWAEFRQRIKASHPECFLVGEIWAQPEVIATYQGELDGCLDFPFTWAITSFIARGETSAAKFAANLRHLDQTYHPAFVTGRFLGNHDMNRFLFEAKGDLRRLKAAAALLMTIPGVPIIYNGDEIGINQERDCRHELAYVRKPMLWGDEQNQALRGFWTQLCRLRRDHDALRRGEMTIVHAGGQVLAYRRGEDVTTVINAGHATQVTIPVAQPVWDALSGRTFNPEGGRLQLSLGEYDHLILIPNPV